MTRLLTAVVVLPVLIASIYFEQLQFLFVAMAAAAMVLALYEFYVLAKKRDLRPDVVAGFFGAAALFTVFYFDRPRALADLLLMSQLVILILVIGTLISGTLRGTPFEKLLGSAGVTLLGVLYIVLLGGHLVALRTGFDQALSADLLFFFFMVLMGSDSGAYYAGRALGRHKLAPKISPGKTWEGVIGGIVAGLGMAALAHFWFFRELPLKFALPLAFLMVVLGIFGDLAESAIKRGAGAKDAANILPGHGGLLDRLDSLLFSAPLIYYFGRFYFGFN